MIVTLGAEVLCIHISYPTTQTDVFDVCGAGDTFTAFAFLQLFDEVEAVSLQTRQQQ